jgi:hypothetical protein
MHIQKTIFKHTRLKKMPFDKELDKELFSEAVEIANSRVTVSVFSYNEGEPKLQIARENKTSAGEFRFSKLGRMSKDEIIAALPLIEKAVEVIKK